MTAFSSQGCSATSATSRSSRTATSVMRPRYGRMNDSVHRTSEGESVRLAHPPTRLVAAGARQRRRLRQVRRDSRNDERDDLVLARIGDIQPAAPGPLGGERHARRRAERFASFAAQVADDPVGPDGADVPVVVVRDEDRDLAARFGHHRHAGGAGEPGLDRRPIVSRIAPRAAGHGRDDARSRIHLADPVVVHVRDVEIAGLRIERHVARHVQRGAGRRVRRRRPRHACRRPARCRRRYESDPFSRRSCAPDSSACRRCRCRRWARPPRRSAC